MSSKTKTLGVCCGVLALLLLIVYGRDVDDVAWLFSQHRQLQQTTNNKAITPPTQTDPASSCNRTSRNSSATDPLLTISLIGRLGNNMFQYAALLGLADTNKKTPFIEYPNALTDTFRITKVRPFSSTTKVASVIHEKSFGVYDPRLNCLPPGNVRLATYLQSFRYFERVKGLIRSEFEFLPHIRKSADKILRDLFTDNHQIEIKNITLVGVHVRRTDLLFKHKIDEGENAAPVEYFKNAFNLMRKKYRNVKFLVASDDPSWSRRFLQAKDVRFIPGPNKAAVDLNVLTQCDHVIMSVGTFSWWAGFLAGGEVVYYGRPAIPGSLKDTQFSMDDHYPKHWIRLGA